MKRAIVSKKVRKASFKEIEKILAFQVEQMKEEASYDKQVVSEDELLEYYILSKKNLVYAIRTYLRFNTGEKIILFDCFGLSNIEFEDKRGNFLILNYNYIFQNGSLQDIGDADILFEE